MPLELFGDTDWDNHSPIVILADDRHPGRRFNATPNLDDIILIPFESGFRPELSPI